MSKEFKNLTGNKVWLSTPIIEKSPLHLGEKFEKEKAEEFYKNHSHLTIYAVGNLVTEYKEGDDVYVDPRAMISAVKLELEGNTKILINALDIIHTWN